MAQKVIADYNEIKAVADEIRSLSGTTEGMKLAGMNNKLSDANDEVAEQADLISQISAVLDGKAGGSASSGSSTVTFEYMGLTTGTLNFYYIDANGTYTIKTGEWKEIDTLEILKNSIFVIKKDTLQTLMVHGDVEEILYNPGINIYYVH